MNHDATITRDITIEDLVELVPRAIPYLMRQRIRCLPCGEPLWGTLEEAAREKGYGDTDIDRFVAEINRLARADRTLTPPPRRRTSSG